jgi:nickel/cobalt transporter (NicO) family protein
MTAEALQALLYLALILGLTHTVMGPDHYIPFIAMSKSGNWSLRKTMVVTLLCGIGHVLSSVVLGLIGVALGLAVGGLEAFEGFRGDIAGWLLLGFGVAYTAWGIRQAIRFKPHTHVHTHQDSEAHSHEHVHAQEHVHVHQVEESKSLRKKLLTPWALFVIFILGPCEPLIPVLMYPAAKQHWFAVCLVALVFSITTIATMSAMVVLGYFGLSKIPSMDRYIHIAAGSAVLACGVAIMVGL